MGRLADGNRKYSLQRLQSVHMEILRRHFVGQKSCEIAKDLGISEVTVSYTINNPLAQEVLENLQAGADASAADVQGRIKELAVDAVEVLEEMMTPIAPPALRLRAATDVLDRAGHGAVKKVEGRVVHGMFTAEELAAIVARAKGLPASQEVPCEVQSAVNE